MQLKGVAKTCTVIFIPAGDEAPPPSVGESGPLRGPHSFS